MNTPARRCEDDLRSPLRDDDIEALSFKRPRHPMFLEHMEARPEIAA